MRKSSPTTAKLGNIAKADSYREAHARIKTAGEQHFYIESAAIMESIISDRLLSYLHGAHGHPPRNKNGTHHSFNNLIQALAKHHQEQDIVDFCQELHDWRDSRNKAIHSIVMSDPGNPTENVDTFLAKAEKCHEKGKKLTRQVENWVKQQNRNSKTNS